MSIPFLMKRGRKKGPELTLPEDCTGKKIALRLTGGVGDVLMAIGGSATTLKGMWPDCEITASVSPYQEELLSHVDAIDNFDEVIALNRDENRNKYDVLLEFSGCFANQREIRDEDYYRLVSNRLGWSVLPPSFDFASCSTRRQGREVVAIHAGASNPNRKWADSNWTVLCHALLSRGLHVLFLGTWDEFSFYGPHVTNCSDVSDTLSYQAETLSTCHYFIGNDSGFAHIAGILGVPGSVLFSTTKPEHVIKHYPSLRSVDNYEALGMIPSRSLRKDCIKAETALGSITVDQILESTPYGAIDCTVGSKMSPVKKKRITIVSIHGTGEVLAKQLSDSYDVDLIKDYNLAHESSVATLFVNQEDCRLLVGDRDVGVNLHLPETIKRALRTLLVEKTSKRDSDKGDE
jgi:ADP-heptose:LPS heptosyltransferase